MMKTVCSLCGAPGSDDVGEVCGEDLAEAHEAYRGCQGRMKPQPKKCVPVDWRAWYAAARSRDALKEEEKMDSHLYQNVDGSFQVVPGPPPPADIAGHLSSRPEQIRAELARRKRARWRLIRNLIGALMCVALGALAAVAHLKANPCQIARGGMLTLPLTPGAVEQRAREGDTFLSIYCESDGSELYAAPWVSGPADNRRRGVNP